MSAQFSLPHHSYRGKHVEQKLSACLSLSHCVDVFCSLEIKERAVESHFSVQDSIQKQSLTS